MSSKILELIENVDVNDTDVADILDEIDARMWCWLNDKDADRKTTSIRGIETAAWYVALYIDCVVPQYTRSRDALKEARPEGWAVQIQSFDYPETGLVKDWWVYLGKDIDCEGHVSKGHTSPNLLTEELAELHAIIQVIRYERKMKILNGPDFKSTNYDPNEEIEDSEGDKEYEKQHKLLHREIL